MSNKSGDSYSLEIKHKGISDKIKLSGDCINKEERRLMDLIITSEGHQVQIAVHDLLLNYADGLLSLDIKKIKGKFRENIKEILLFGKNKEDIVETVKKIEISTPGGTEVFKK